MHFVYNMYVRAQSKLGHNTNDSQSNMKPDDYGPSRTMSNLHSQAKRMETTPLGDTPADNDEQGHSGMLNTTAMEDRLHPLVIKIKKNDNTQ